MIDYAESVVKKSVGIDVEKSVGVSVISVPLPYLFIIFMISAFIYTTAYQNSSIAQCRHVINNKKNELAQLKLKVDYLTLEKEKIFNSAYVIAHAKSKDLKIAKSKDIQVVY